MTGREAVVAVEVVVVELLSGHTHGVGIVVEQHERHRKPVVHRGVHLHAVHVERAVPGDHHHTLTRGSSFLAGERHSDPGSEAVTHPTHAEGDREPTRRRTGR